MIERAAEEMLSLAFDELVMHTEEAWCLDFGGERVWLPQGECELFYGDRVVAVPLRLAVEKGLEPYEV